MTLIRNRTSDPLDTVAGLLGLDHVWGWEPSLRPDACDPEWKFVKLGSDKVAVGYLTHDESPSDFWEDGGNGEFKVFRTQWDRDGWINERQERGLTVYVVDEYKHGLVHYSVRDTAGYTDREWDVAPRAALAIPFEDWGTDAADQLGVANGILDEYSKWCNGEVYGACVAVLTINRENGEVVDEDDNSVWGAIGREWARDLLEEEMPTS